MLQLLQRLLLHASSCFHSGGWASTNGITGLPSLHHYMRMNKINLVPAWLEDISCN